MFAKKKPEGRAPAPSFAFTDLLRYNTKPTRSNA